MREKRPDAWELTIELSPGPNTGRRRRRSRYVHGTRDDAVAAVASLRAEEVARLGVPRTATVALLMRRWLDKVAATLSPTTLREYWRLVETRIEPALGTICVAELTRARLKVRLHDLRHAHASELLAAGIPGQHGRQPARASKPDHHAPEVRANARGDRPRRCRAAAAAQQLLETSDPQS